MDAPYPEHWKEAESAVKYLIQATGWAAANAAIHAVYDIHCKAFRDIPSGDNYGKLQMSMNAIQIVRDQGKRAG